MGWTCLPFPCLCGRFWGWAVLWWEEAGPGCPCLGSPGLQQLLPVLPWVSPLLCGCRLHPALPPSGQCSFSPAVSIWTPQELSLDSACPAGLGSEPSDQGEVRSLPSELHPDPMAQDQWPLFPAPSVLRGCGHEGTGTPPQLLFMTR